VASYVDEFIHAFSVTGTSETASAMREQGDNAANTQTSFDRLSTTFMALSGQFSAWGNQATQMSDTWAATYRQADLVTVRLDALGKTRGIPPAAIKSVDDMTESLMKASGFKESDLRQASVTLINMGMSADQVNQILPMLARQARTTGQDVGTMAMAMGKAFSTGNVMALRRARITMDETTEAEIKLKAKTVDWSDAAQVAALRALVMEGAMKGIDSHAASLSDVMNTASGRADIYAAKQEKVEESLGKGAQKVVEMRMHVMGLAQDYALANEGAAEFAGGAMSVGGEALKAMGFVGGLSKNIVDMHAMMKLAKGGKDALAVATKADNAAELAKSGTALKEAAAIGKGTKAVEEAAKAKGLLGKAGAAEGIFGKAGSLGGLLGMTGNMPMSAGAAVAAAPAMSVALMAGAGVGGWLIGTKIAEAFNIGGARELKDAKEAQKKMETEMGGKVGDAITPDMVQAAKRRRGLARPTPGGDLRVTIPGDEVMTTQAMDDYSLAR
jgi:hypothetical protein